jgi:hypothetical protein
MTARDVLDGIKARLAAGVHPGERWTSWPELTMDSIIMHRVYDDQRRCVAECSSPDVAEVLAAAPTDVARLTAAVDAVLAKHKPEKRWTHPDWTGSFDSREEAAEYDYDEAMGDDQKSQVDHFVVCAECGYIEAEQLRDSGDEWSYKHSIWPCPTVAAIENALEGEQ